MRRHILNLFLRTLNFFVPKRNNQIVFIPHKGIYLTDKASIKNYGAENTLTFLHYLLKKKPEENLIFYVASGDISKIQTEQEYINYYFPYARVKFFSYFDRKNVKGIAKYGKIWRDIRIFLRSKYFFVSEPHCFPYKVGTQKVICLSYYSVPFKNDYFQKDNKVQINFAEEAKHIDYFMTNSLLASQINAHALGLPLFKLINLGMCRNDNFSNQPSDTVKSYFLKQVDFPVVRIILYVPTHRDYEAAEFDIKRSILGFPLDKNKLATFLKNNNTIIICKLHPKQNAAVIQADLPKGIINFSGHTDFGLTELMQISDVLITDYTSAFFDYILLDKPVLFNFYDFDTYKNIRGFSYDPIEPICAGDKFFNESGFYKCLEKVMINQDDYKDQRRLISALVNKYDLEDQGACERIYDFVFKQKLKPNA